MERSTRTMLALLAALRFPGCASVEETWYVDAAAETTDTTIRDASADPRADEAIMDVAADDARPVDVASEDAAVDDGVTDAADEDDAFPPCDTDLGTFTPGETATMLDSTSGEYWDVLGSIGTSLFADPLSAVVVQSNVGMGGPVTPGTYTISSFVSPMSCAVCIYAAVDCDLATGTCASMYSADSATLEITALENRDGGRIAGTLYDVHMVEVEPTTGTLVPRGRTFCLDGWTFSELFVAF